MKIEKHIEKYFENAKESTTIGEHLYILNSLLLQVVKNTTPDIVGLEDKVYKKNNL